MFKCRCCSVTQLCLTLCNPVGCSKSGFPVLHHLLELAQTHVHRVSDAIQPSHPLSSPYPLVCNVSQDHSLHVLRGLVGLQHCQSLFDL